MEAKQQESNKDIKDLIAEINKSFYDNFTKLKSINKWPNNDARLQVFFNCYDLSANSAFSIGLLDFANTNGLNTKEWWDKWSIFRPKDQKDLEHLVKHNNILYKQKVREQLMISSQIYIESFLRNLARQFNIDKINFWDLKKEFLENKLNFTQKEIEPLLIFQHLRNTIHNKGIHYNKNHPDLQYSINDFDFNFKFNKEIKISWLHFKELLIANSNLLYKIILNPLVTNLPCFEEQNVEDLI